MHKQFFKNRKSKPAHFKAEPTSKLQLNSSSVESSIHGQLQEGIDPAPTKNDGTRVLVGVVVTCLL